jgi:hypothetical protein
MDSSLPTNLINTTFNEQSIQPEWDGAINYTYVISPTVVNSFIGSVLWYSAYFGPANVSAVAAIVPVPLGTLPTAAPTAAGASIPWDLKLGIISRKAAMWAKAS